MTVKLPGVGSLIHVKRFTSPDFEVIWYYGVVSRHELDDGAEVWFAFLQDGKEAMLDTNDFKYGNAIVLIQ